MMLDCKLCNYYEVLTHADKGTAKCEFTDIIFMEDVETLDIEYPCKNIPFADYLKRKQGMKQNQKHGQRQDQKQDSQPA